MQSLSIFLSFSFWYSTISSLSLYLYTTGTPHTYTLFLSLDNLYFTYMHSLSIFLSWNTPSFSLEILSFSLEILYLSLLKYRYLKSLSFSLEILHLSLSKYYLSLLKYSIFLSWNTGISRVCKTLSSDTFTTTRYILDVFHEAVVCCERGKDGKRV